MDTNDVTYRCKHVVETVNFADEAILLPELSSSPVLVIEVSSVRIAKFLDELFDVGGTDADRGCGWT